MEIKYLKSYRRKRVNPRVIKVKMSKFKRKRKGDKGEKIDYEKHTQIIPPGESIKATYGTVT